MYDPSLATINICNNHLVRETSTRFLGYFVDEHLTWKKHIEYVSLKIAKNIGVINRLKYILPDDVLLSLYHTMIFPYLMYGNIVWASTYPTRLDKLFKLQKRIVRILSHSDYLAHTAPLFNNLKILNIFNINIFQIACFVHKYLNKTLPHYFNDFFSRNDEIHSYNTRKSRALHHFLNRTTLFKYALRQRGPVIWNTLSSEIKMLSDLYIFKTKLKTFLCSN